MSERERWIVYPLLFLALGAALRDKLFDRTTSKSIVCQELTVVDAEPSVGNRARILARIGPAESHSGHKSTGHFFVSGPVEVQGYVNAQQYAMQGVPLVPTLPALPVGVSWSDLLKAAQQAAQLRQQQNAASQQQDPNDAQPQSTLPSQPPPQDQPPQTPPAQQDPPAEPLADPAENR